MFIASVKIQPAVFADTSISLLRVAQFKSGYITENYNIFKPKGLILYSPGSVLQNLSNHK
jgi:hypothetical protein